VPGGCFFLIAFRLSPELTSVLYEANEQLYGLELSEGLLSTGQSGHSQQQRFVLSGEHPMKWAQYLLIPYLALTAACGQKVDSSQWGSPAPVLTDTPPSSMKILVVGGTSGVGLETVKLALERGHDVIAAARHPERMTITNSHLHVVKSDILDPTSIGKAIQGVDSVVIAIGISPTRDSVSVFSEGSANVLTAMKHHGVTRLISSNRFF
jgi:NADPH:quinone reductase-like Zn-dependent oxidoreductase